MISSYFDLTTQIWTDILTCTCRWHMVLHSKSLLKKTIYIFKLEILYSCLNKTLWTSFLKIGYNSLDNAVFLSIYIRRNTKNLRYLLSKELIDDHMICHNWQIKRIIWLDTHSHPLITLLVESYTVNYRCKESKGLKKNKGQDYTDTNLCFGQKLLSYESDKKKLLVLYYYCLWIRLSNRSSCSPIVEV